MGYQAEIESIAKTCDNTEYWMNEIMPQLVASIAKQYGYDYNKVLADVWNAC